MRTIILYILLSSLFTISFAHIVSVSGPTTFKAKANSKYPLTFHTIDGPITNEDFSVAVGLQFSSSAHGPPALGSFIENFDLVAKGHSSTANGNFTLNVSLPSSTFFDGPGRYVLTAAVTNALGALWNVELLFFNTTFTVSGV